MPLCSKVIKMFRLAVVVLLSTSYAVGTESNVDSVLFRFNENTRDMILKLINASSSDSVQIYPGITLERIGKSTHPLKLDSVKQVTNHSNLETLKLLHLLYTSTSNFLLGRVLKVKIPENATVARAFTESKEIMNNILRPFRRVKYTEMMLNTILSFLVTKALVVAKVALVAALVNIAITIFGGRPLWNSGSISTYASPTSSYGAPSYSYGPPA